MEKLYRSMKLQLDEHTLNLYLSRAINEEINELKIPMKVPHGRKIEDPNDLVLIFNQNDEVIDFGSVGYSAYKDELLRWNEENGYYELVDMPGYKMVCCR